MSIVSCNKVSKHVFGAVPPFVIELLPLLGVPRGGVRAFWRRGRCGLYGGRYAGGGSAFGADWCELVAFEYRHCYFLVHTLLSQSIKNDWTTALQSREGMDGIYAFFKEKPSDETNFLKYLLVCGVAFNRRVLDSAQFFALRGTWQSAQLSIGPCVVLITSLLGLGYSYGSPVLLAH